MTGLGMPPKNSHSGEAMAAARAAKRSHDLASMKAPQIIRSISRRGSSRETRRRKRSA
jgi:hypothetical protein